ncbi:InlB B-repeat-containing protein, partial [Olsenella sp. KH1P3]
VDVLTDQTVTLPNGASTVASSISRAGYTLVGWTTQRTVSGTDVGTSTGLASRSAAQAAAALAGRTSSAGKAFTAAGGSYVAPTASEVTLYAVWSADTDTAYYVERYVVTGDGDLIALRADGTVERDADGNVVAQADPAAYAAGQRVSHQGVTDEYAVADAATADPEKSWINHDNTARPGYSYADHSHPYTARSKVTGVETTYATIATDGISGDGLMRLSLYYTPDATHIIFDKGGAELASGEIDSSWVAGDPSADHLTGSTFTLPGTADVTRPGYTLVGWSTDPIAATAKGNDSRSKADTVASSTADDPAAGKHFSVQGTTYFVPTDATVTLHAVWKANDDTTYYVERYVITADGRVIALEQDGTIPRSGDNTPIEHGNHDGSAFIVANRIERTGVTDEEAIADADTSIGTPKWRTHDNIVMAGYHYIKDGVTYSDLLGNSYMTVASGNIDGTGDMILVLYYFADENSTYTVNHHRVTGDGVEKDLIVEIISKGTDTPAISRKRSGVEGDEAYDPDFVGYEYKQTFTDVNGVTYVSHDVDVVLGDGSMVLNLYYAARIDVRLEIVAGDSDGNGSWSLGNFVSNETSESTLKISEVLATLGYVLPTRAGYDLVGWSLVADGAMGPSARGERSVETARRLESVENGEFVDPDAGEGDQLGGASLLAMLLRAFADENPTFEMPNAMFIEPDGTFLMPTSQVTLYAIWRARSDTTYTVTHYLVDADGVAHEVEGDTREFTGITDGSYVVDADGNVTHTYDPAATDDDINNAQVTAGEKPAGYYPGYTYVSDYDNGEGDTGLSAANLDGEGTLALKFFYTANIDTPYIVRHIRVTGDKVTLEEVIENLTGTTDTTVTAIPFDTETHGGFTGYTVIVDPDTPITLADGTLVYSHPKDNLNGDESTVLWLYYIANDHTLTLDPNRGTWTDDASGLDDDGRGEGSWSTYDGSFGVREDEAETSTDTLPRTFTYGTDSIITLPTEDDVKRNGYTLGGWEDEDGNVYEPGGAYTMPDHDSILKPVWIQNVYNLHFDKNDPVATGRMEDVEYTYDDPDFQLGKTGFSRRNAKFLGWSFSPDATEPDISDEQLMRALTLLAAGELDDGLFGDLDDPRTAMYLLAALADGSDITLYAVWDIEKHTPSVVGGVQPGGSVTIDPEAIEYGFTIPHEAVGIDVTPGYYLKGWLITINGVTTYVEDPDAIFNTPMTADIIFEPVWGNYAEDAARLARGRRFKYAGERIPQTGDLASDLAGFAALLGVAFVAAGAYRRLCQEP